MLYNYVWTSRLPNFRLIHSFLANTLPKNRTRWWHHFLRLRFWPFLNIAQSFFFNSESKRLQKYFFPKKQTFGNLASCDLGLTRPFTVVDFHGSRSQNGLVSYSTCKKWPYIMCLTAEKNDSGDLSWPFVTCFWPWPVPSMALMLIGYLHQPIEIILAEFRAKTIDIACPRLRHTETSKFDLSANLDTRLKTNKILRMLWKDHVKGFRTPPRGARYDHWFWR